MTKQYKTVNQPLNAEGLLSLKGKGIQFFSEPPAPPEPPTDPAGTPPGGNEPPATPPAEPPTEPDKTFTQDDVNNLIARESKTAQEKLLKKLGIEDFDSAKDGLEKFRTWQDEQKTEAEKQAEALKNFETQNGALSNENETLKASLSALKVGVLADSIPDVVTLAKTLVTDDVDMDAAIAQVVEKYPHFAQVAEPEPDPNAPPKPQFAGGQYQPAPPATMDEKMLQAVKDKFGRK